MKIWMLRHGEAGHSRGRDADRELTEYGRRQARASAQHLRGVKFDQILCSPYIRARQTAAEVLDELGLERQPMLVPWLVPDEPVSGAVRQLDSLSKGEILLVTHQPLVGLLGGWLCDGDLSSPLPMGTASLACLEGEYAVAGLMRLQSLQHADIR